MGRRHDGKIGVAHREEVFQGHRPRQTGASRSPPLCRIPDYAKSSMKHLRLALSWRTETIKPSRHSREGVIGLSRRPPGDRLADSDLLLR